MAIRASLASLNESGSGGRRRPNVDVTRQGLSPSLVNSRNLLVEPTTRCRRRPPRLGYAFTHQGGDALGKLPGACVVLCSNLVEVPAIALAEVVPAQRDAVVDTPLEGQPQGVVRPQGTEVANDAVAVLI